MQILFAWDAQGQNDQSIARQIATDSAEETPLQIEALEMADGAWQQRATIDNWIERLAPKWPPRRQPGVDRALLRLAAWEIIESRIPPKVAIAEALELAKAFSTAQSAAFINGVLDSLLKEHQALTKLTPASEE